MNIGLEVGQNVRIPCHVLSLSIIEYFISRFSSWVIGAESCCSLPQLLSLPVNSSDASVGRFDALVDKSDALVYKPDVLFIGLMFWFISLMFCSISLIFFSIILLFIGFVFGLLDLLLYVVFSGFELVPVFVQIVFGFVICIEILLLFVGGRVVE